jgi:hypothetical protein
MSISGVWINELGSRTKLRTDENGILRGTYHTQVGDAEGIYLLIGAYMTLRFKTAASAFRFVFLGTTTSSTAIQ